MLQEENVSRVVHSRRFFDKLALNGIRFHTARPLLPNFLIFLFSLSQEKLLPTSWANVREHIRFSFDR